MKENYIAAYQEEKKLKKYRLLYIKCRAYRCLIMYIILLLSLIPFEKIFQGRLFSSAHLHLYPQFKCSKMCVFFW